MVVLSGSVVQSVVVSMKWFTKHRMRIKLNVGAVVDLHSSNFSVHSRREATGTVKRAETWQRDSSVGVDIPVEPLVHPLDQVLLVEEGVVSAERARRVDETLVVVAELGLAARWQELIHMHHLTQ